MKSRAATPTSLKTNNEKKSRPSEFKRIFIILGSLLFVGAVGISFVFIFSHVYRDKVLPNTRVGSLSLGGKTYAQARQLLQEAVDQLGDRGLSLSYGGASFSIPSTVEDPANPELSSPLFSYDINKTVDQLRQANTKSNETEKVFYWIRGRTIFPVVTVDSAKLTEALAEELQQYEQPAKDAQLVIDKDNAISITSEAGGQAFNYPQIVATVTDHLSRLSGQTISVALEKDIPAITKAAAEPAVSLAHQVLETAPFTLSYQDRQWVISKDQVHDWLTFVATQNQITVGLGDKQLTTYLKEIAGQIDVETKEAKFTMQNGRVTEFQPSQSGLKLDINATAAVINQKIKLIGVPEIDLVVAEAKPTVAMNDVNSLGINELVGEGHSNFKGSPKNRRHNISVGAAALNGVLIKPGEEFSLVKTLGKIEASTGYLPELVIKGNKTIPEYGGGLCQIGTTTFRTALDAGLPITARTNHSYRVSYYEPAGTDATIYDPNPDFRFINDTGHYILFTTEMTGDDLYFRFYGTKDGRKVAQTTPRIFNQVRPGAAKLVETTDLKPGEKKCTEKAHTGADAEFTRTITYATGEKKVDTFRSHYKPWQEVCLIGVEKLSTPPPAT